ILQAWNRNRRIGNLLGVRYAVDNKLIRSRGVRLVYKKDPVYISEDSDAFPLAFLARKVRVFDDPKELFRELAAGNSNLRDIALLEQEIAPLGETADEMHQPDEEVAFILDTPGKYVMRTCAGGPRQLVLTETYHPQWRCTIDGVEAPVYLTDFTFMSVRVPPGEHEIRWWFEPTRFRQGLAVSTSTFALIVGLAGLSAFKRRRRQKVEPDDFECAET
ncbi:MAG: hypothetical protein ACYSTL_04705, partial [Planctomycetota bacterium]